ncbi:Rieske (2Fe-2S) protein [Nocardioides rotundus]|uniref:Rieske (2Fe-2S) protein n=1 Tax=Nocardioides rotundus TaxID=1774216 RepID=UPI001CBD5868|nr:Rieske (2Fe-2S) protein [Nocardioides rotundus]UAL31635.1 Rieske (2Fe-2S) protein [Nocardioides rotundus]
MTRSTPRPSSVNRRQVVGGVAALGVGAPLLAACGSDSAGGGESADTPSGGSADSGGGASTSGSGGELATADVPEGGGVILEDSETVVTQPSAGEFKAFSSICTHQGCAVTKVATTIDCPCHGSKFSISDGSVVAGPASKPLPEKSVTVDGDTLTVG